MSTDPRAGDMDPPAPLDTPDTPGAQSPPAQDANGEVHATVPTAATSDVDSGRPATDDGSEAEAGPEELTDAAVAQETEAALAEDGAEPVAAEDTSDVDPALAALTAKAAKADEYLALAQRTKADFENYRKRSIREVAAAQERGIAKLARELLPAVDNLDRALTAAQTAAAAAGEGDEVHAQLVSGIQLVYADVISALQRAGIEPFSPEGEPFDPQCHEAVAQAPFEGAQPGSVVEVYQRGYRIGESVLRPARVLVAA